MINKIIIFLFLSLSLFASPSYSVGTSYGRGSTKPEAYASAISRVPAGAMVTGVGFNGNHSRSLDNKFYDGKYTCHITWRVYEQP